MNKKGQALVEYVLLLLMVSLSFTVITNMFDKAIMSFFLYIGNFFATSSNLQ